MSDFTSFRYFITSHILARWKENSKTKSSFSEEFLNGKQRFISKQFSLTKQILFTGKEIFRLETYVFETILWNKKKIDSSLNLILSTSIILIKKNSHVYRSKYYLEKCQFWHFLL